jgi:hypothetical protein
MNWPQLLRWAVHQGIARDDLMAMTLYELAVLMGAVGPDEPVVRMSLEDWQAWRASQSK